MPPQSGTALILLVAFVLPGFVTVSIQERTFRLAFEETPFDRLLRAVYYSVWCYLLVGIVAVLAGIDRPEVESFVREHSDSPALMIVAATTAMLVIASVIATATRLWDDSKSLRPATLKLLGINQRHLTPTGWDFLFADTYETCVRVTLSSGQKILGYYGRESFAAYAKDGADLFLQSLYESDKNGWFKGAADGSRGVWISASEVVCIEFYDPGSDEPSNDDPND